MKNNSSYLVLCFLTKAGKIIKSEGYDFNDIFKTDKNDYYRYKNSKDYTKKVGKRIYNELENHIYTYKDLLIYLLYNYSFDKNIKIYQIYPTDIKKIAKIFTKKQIKNDEDFIIKMNQNLKLKNVSELFEIRENGEPIIYDLIKNNYVSVAIYVKLYEKLLTTKNKDVIFKSDNYKRFEYAMKNIIKIIKGGFDAEKKICY